MNKMSFSDSFPDYASQTICGYPIRRIESVWLCSSVLQRTAVSRPDILYPGQKAPEVLSVGSVCDDDLGELINWSIPRFEFLPGINGKNISFHPLPSGKYCISCTFWSPDFDSALEYQRPKRISESRCFIPAVSSRLPLAVQLDKRSQEEAFPEYTNGLFTHCMVVSQETLGCFSNHPFVLFEALRRDKIGCQKPNNCRIPGSKLSSDATIRSLVHSLSQFQHSPIDYEPFLMLAQREDPVVVYGRGNLCKWFAGLFNQIEPSRRLDYSFCTAAPFSVNRPFRITGIGKNHAELRRVKRDYGQIPRWSVAPENPEESHVKPADPDLVYLWRYLKESFWGDREKFLQGIELWKEYCRKNSNMVDSARASLLEWSVNAYQGLHNMQLKEPKQMDAMMDMIDVLLQ